MTSILMIGLSSSGLSWGGAFQNDIVQMVLHAGPVVKFVLLVLFLFSLVSWAIIFVIAASLEAIKTRSSTAVMRVW